MYAQVYTKNSQHIFLVDVGPQKGFRLSNVPSFWLCLTLDESRLIARDGRHLVCWLCFYFFNFCWLSPIEERQVTEHLNKYPKQRYPWNSISQPSKHFFSLMKLRPTICFHVSRRIKIHYDLLESFSPYPSWTTVLTRTSVEIVEGGYGWLSKVVTGAANQEIFSKSIWGRRCKTIGRRSKIKNPSDFYLLLSFLTG